MVAADGEHHAAREDLDEGHQDEGSGVGVECAEVVRGVEPDDGGSAAVFGEDPERHPRTNADDPEGRAARGGDRDERVVGPAVDAGECGARTSQGEAGDDATRGVLGAGSSDREVV